MAWTVLAIAVPILALFGPALLTDRTFAMRDAAHYYYPLYHWTSSEWRAGRVPLWNPHENCGVPVAADATSALFYPGQLIFALPLDFALRYKLYVIGHIVLAAAAAYWLARHWQASQCGAALAAISYACGGEVAFQQCNVVYLVGAAWLPLAALAVDSLCRQPSLSALLGLSAAVAMMILGGDPQAAYHVLLMAAIYCVLLLFGKRGEGVTGEERPRAIKILALPPAFGLAILLAAVQIAPSAEATRSSERALYNQPRSLYELHSPADLGQLFTQPEPGTHHATAYDFSVAPWRLAELIWPNVGGRMFPTHRRWFSLIPAEGRIWTPSLYLGLLPLVLGLSVFRLWGGSDVRIRWLSWLTLIFTLGSFGAYGLGWAAREIYVGLLGGDGESFPIGSPVGGVYWFFVVALPKYIYFRYPAKLLIVAALGISQLAAIGWDRHVKKHESGRLAPRVAGWASPSSLLLYLGIASGIAAAIALVTSQFVVLGQGIIDPTFGPFDSRGAWRDIIAALVQTTVVSLAVWWLLGRVASPGKESWQLALVGLSALELSLANYWLVPTAPADEWRKPSLAAQQIEPGSGRVLRAAGAWRPLEFSKAGSPQRLRELLQFERDTLHPKYHLLNGLTVADSYGGLQAADYELLLQVAEEYAQPQADGTPLPHPAIVRLLGVRWLVLPDGCRPDFAEPTTTANVWRVRDPLPRVWVADWIEEQRPLLPGASQEEWLEHTREALFPGGKPRDFLQKPVIELSRPGPLVPARDLPQIEESCRIVYDSPQLVRVEVALNRPGTLVLADRYVPGWRARIVPAKPGKAPWDTDIVRANRVFRGVLVPQGRHMVEYRYVPESVIRGGVISAVSWLLLAIAAVATWIWRRKPLAHMQ